MNKYWIRAKNDVVSKEIENRINDFLKGSEFIAEEENPEIVIVIGGDGTFLRAVHHYIDTIDSIHFIGIHTGTLGFFTSYSTEEVDQFLDDLLNRAPEVDRKQLLEISIDSGIKKMYALNEARIENVIQTQIIHVSIDGSELETFRGTGLCISTQAGSTAYNRSLGGAVIHSDLELLQLTEITGIHHRKFESLQAPLILSRNASIQLESKNFENALLCYDNLHTKLDGYSKVECKLSEKRVNFLRYHKENYLKRIKNLF